MFSEALLIQQRNLWLVFQMNSKKSVPNIWNVTLGFSDWWLEGFSDTNKHLEEQILDQMRSYSGRRLPDFLVETEQLIGEPPILPAWSL